MYFVLNKLLKCTDFYISKDSASYTFLLVFKIVESLSVFLKSTMEVREQQVTFVQI